MAGDSRGSSVSAAPPPRRCQRCGEHDATQNVRTQKLCDTCFLHHISTRPIKRISTLRQPPPQPPSQPPLRSPNTHHPKPPPPPTLHYLLALSLGASSSALLHILSTHIRSMLSRSGRATYSIHVLHVWDDASFPSPPDMGKWREAYPGVEFETAPLSLALGVWRPPGGLFPDVRPAGDAEREVGSVGGVGASSSSGLEREREGQGGSQGGSERGKREELAALLSSKVLSPTARQDLRTILLSNAILAFAMEKGFTTVLRGDSATKLAEKVMGDVAKGRGGGVSAALGEEYVAYPLTERTEDGLEEQGEQGDEQGGQAKIRIAFPMRDVLRRDAVTFVSLARTPAQKVGEANGRPDDGVQNGADGEGIRLNDLVMEEPKGEGKRQRMMRDMGIDELMESYFKDVEGSYPGVVSNVVRTVDKLGIRRDGDEGGGRCSCCGGFLSTSSSLGEDQGGAIGRDTVEGICARCERDFA